MTTDPEIKLPDPAVVDWDLFWQARWAEFCFALPTMYLVWLMFGAYLIFPAEVTLETLVSSVFLAIFIGGFFELFFLYLPLGMAAFAILQLFGLKRVESFCAFNALWYALYSLPLMFEFTEGDVADPLWLAWGMIVLFNYCYPDRAIAPERQPESKVAARGGRVKASFDVV